MLNTAKRSIQEIVDFALQYVLFHSPPHKDEKPGYWFQQHKDKFPGLENLTSNDIKNVRWPTPENPLFYAEPKGRSRYSQALIDAQKNSVK